MSDTELDWCSVTFISTGVLRDCKPSVCLLSTPADLVGAHNSVAALVLVLGDRTR